MPSRYDYRENCWRYINVRNGGSRMVYLRAYLDRELEDQIAFMKARRRIRTRGHTYESSIPKKFRVPLNHRIRNKDR